MNRAPKSDFSCELEGNGSAHRRIDHKYHTEFELRTLAVRNVPLLMQKGVNNVI